MAAQSDAHCICARDDVEASANGRCLRCGRLLRETFAVVAAPDRNRGVHHTSPSGAYRSPAAPFEASRSVATTTARDNLRAMTRDAQEQGLYDLPEVSADELAAAQAPSPEPSVIPEQGAGPETVPPTPPPSPLAVEAQPAAPAPSALGRPTREWIETTRALGEELLTAADEQDRQADAARAQAATHAAEAVRLRKSAAIFAQLLRAVDVPIAPEPESAQPSPPLPQPSSGLRWSRNSAVQVDACIGCGRADVPHLANGRCSRCDYKWRAAGQPKGAA